MTATPDKTIRVLSIDAWRDGDGWTWNQWFNRGTCPLSVCDMKPRALLRFMRHEGYLSDGSKGCVAVEDDGYNMVIVARHTREPLFALEYGAVEFTGGTHGPESVS